MNDYIEYAEIGGIEGLEEYLQFRAEQEGILAAENAWLIAAESPTAEDEAFARWEMDRGCWMDRQSGY